MTNSLNKVLVAMSGGVDSSTAAAMLVEMGYDVTGITITTLKISYSQAKGNERTCCSLKNTLDAANVCKYLGIKHIIIDLSEIFQKTIINNFISEYLNGRTPNPCVLCNPLIKWNTFLSQANQLRYYYLATGHYAKVRYDSNLNRYILSKASDISKDQSYVLWALSQEQLSRTIFPLSDITKKETRNRAAKFGLNVADKPESQEICFIPDNDYRNFIRKSAFDKINKIGYGNIYYNGKIIGRHKGFHNFTIGQRKGLGISYKIPLYVKELHPDKNSIILSTNKELYQKSLIANKINLIKYESIFGKHYFNVKIRYNDHPGTAECIVNEDGKLIVNFIEPKRAITPGQSVVLYENDDLVGGGIILQGF